MAQRDWRGTGGHGDDHIPRQAEGVDMQYPLVMQMGQVESQVGTFETDNPSLTRLIDAGQTFIMKTDEQGRLIFNPVTTLDVALGDNPTLRDVYNSLNPQQKTLVDYLVGVARASG